MTLTHPEPGFQGHLGFYQNVTTLRLRLCCRRSVCLSSVCNVGAPYSGSWTFHQYFFTAVCAGHPLTSTQNFTEIVSRKPPPHRRR